MKLEDSVGKHIREFCQNGFISDTTNHCAHFVSHMLGMDFDMTCKKLTGKRHAGANVRVQELFPRCPEVGEIADAPAAMVLVFATDVANVDLEAKTIRNVPKKHVGVLSNGNVYHYSNDQYKVVKQSLDDFRSSMKRNYGGNQGLFYGTLPAGAILPDDMPVSSSRVIAASASEEGRVAWRIENKELLAQVDGGPDFHVAEVTRYGGRIGLAQIRKLTGPVYDPSKYVVEYGQWAYLVYAIGISESEGRFNRLNSYDRAAFTFGFFQMAAHTPEDNLILFLRRATELPEFHDFFPELQLVNGRLHQVTPGVSTDLEVATYNPVAKEDQLQRLMRYLNPSESGVDAEEAVHAAKLVTLCATSAAFTSLQVRTAVQITTRKFRTRYQRWYGLDGVSDTLCLAIADIHHQGRGGKTAVQAALKSPNPLVALCKIGENKHPKRCESLRAAIRQLESQGKLGKHVYEPAHGLFVPA